MSRRRLGTVVVLFAIGLSSAPACHRSDSSPVHVGPPHLASTAELTDAERRYGHSAARDPKVTYQPDVVIVDGGANAVRGLRSDGLGCSIDAKARHAAEIVPGKIAMLTGECVGRVLAVQKEGDQLSLILGPVELTDVIQKGSFHVEQPINLDDTLVFEAPEFPGADTPLRPIIASSAVPSGTRGSLDWQSPAVFLAMNGPVTVHRFRVEPRVSVKGIGVHVTSSAGGVQFLGDAMLHLDWPLVVFTLDMDGSKIKVCELEIKGAAGLTMAFEATSESGLAGNVNERVDLPVDFAIPITGMAVPFSVVVRQVFTVQTVFTSKSSHIKARGDYTFGGSFSVGYRDSKFEIGGPTGLKLNESLLQSTAGVSFGPTGLVMAHQAKLIVGIGAFGFVTGPYGALNSSVAVSRGSDLGIVVCRGATLTMNVAAGIGYVMPQAVTNAINAILHALNIGEIKGSGGLETKPLPLVNVTSYKPVLEVCKQGVGG